MAITDGSLSTRVREVGFHKGIVELVGRCVRWADAEVDHILLREKDADAVLLVEACRAVVLALRGREVMTLIASAPDLAREAGAGGVHVPFRDFSHVKKAMGDGFVCVSCHSVDEVWTARRDGASAIVFAPVFGKQVDGVEVAAGVGLERLHEACVAAGAMPVFALGGVTEGNAEACVEAGAAGIAGIRMFSDAP